MLGRRARGTASPKRGFLGFWNAAPAPGNACGCHAPRMPGWARARGRPHGACSGRRFVCSRRVSHRAPRSVRPKAGRTLGPGGGGVAIRAGAARRRRCASPAPARSPARAAPPPPARSAPPPPGNVVSGSRRRSPIGRPRAPRHNGAAPGRRAGQRRGFPLRRSRRRSASAGGSARPGRAARAPEGGLQAPR